MRKSTPLFAKTLLALTVCLLASGAELTAGQKSRPEASMRVSATVIRPCLVSVGSGDVGVSCTSNGVKPQVIASTTTATGETTPVKVEQNGGTTYSVAPPPVTSAPGVLDSTEVPDTPETTAANRHVTVTILF